MLVTYQTIRCYKLEDLNFYCHMTKLIRDRQSQHYKVVINGHVISIATRNTLGKRRRVLTNYFCKPAKNSGIRSVNATLSQWASVKLCDLTKPAEFTAKELPIQLSQGSLPVAFYCDENGVYISWRCETCVITMEELYLHSWYSDIGGKAVTLITQYSWQEFTSADTCSASQPRWVKLDRISVVFLFKIWWHTA
jgi:hypothetical protein